MRDIVTRDLGTFYGGLTALPTISATQHSPAISSATFGKYDGLAVYILVGAVTGTGTMTVTLEVTNDSGGSPVSNNWTSIPTSDVLVWQATSASDGTPVRLGYQQPAPITQTTNFNQRAGWLGSLQTFTANASPGDGLSHSIDWFRVSATVSGSWSAPFDIITILGRPRYQPAAV